MKIFGIGLSKTGTTSLATALEILGYRTRDYPGLTSYAPGDLASIDTEVLEANEALTDTPIPSFYRELDRQYPRSKFILTIRDMPGWLLSCKKQFTPKLAEKQNDAHNRLFMDLYGTTVFDEELFRRGYERFVGGVLEHFRSRPHDLLVLNVAAGDGWDQLCPFLGRPTPPMPFPKANVTRIRWMDLQELVSIAREAGEELLRAHRSIAPARAEAALVNPIHNLVRKTVYSVRGGRTFAIESATEAAHKVLTKRLSKLNADIAVISRRSHDVPPSVRDRWNHFWMVDPLDGDAAFGTTDGGFTVNLALIEDHKPIAGVVHLPLTNTTYFAMVGKGAFEQVDGGVATRLDDGRSTSVLRSASSGSKALALCGSALAAEATAQEIDGTMEWHTAAPHALLRLIGRRVVTLAGADLRYNKPDWCNPRVRVV